MKREESSRHAKNSRFRDDLPEGWQPLFDQLLADLERIDSSLAIQQTKEKFGELRVYLAGYVPGAHDLIDTARRRSRAACQRCGCPGVLRVRDGLYATLCDEHGQGFAIARQEPILASLRVGAGGVTKVDRDPLG